MVRVYFDTQHLYYLPQYLPVAKKLIKAGVHCIFNLYPENGFDALKKRELEQANIPYNFIDSPKSAHVFYRQNQSDWIIFGNRPQFDPPEKENIKAKLALVQHGIGPKSCYYDVSEFPFDVRFVEGQQRLQRLQSRFSGATFVDTGYAKLDPLFDSSPAPLSLSDLGLSEHKPTILYAPTFYPSSIEHFNARLPEQLSDYNVIVKPHYFSLVKDKYAAQRALFAQWSNAEHVHVTNVEDYNLLPYMQLSDVMLSDASSAIFEYAALNKPVVWCDFYQTRWSYRGLLKFRLKNRLDPDIELFHQLCLRAKSPKEVPTAIQAVLKDPSDLEQQRLKITGDMVGTTDGKCGDRICEYIILNS